MTHGIINQSIVPIRAEPSHSSEMVSQLLFGELFEIKERQNEWLRIKSEYDDYTGWMIASQSQFLDLFEFEKIKKTNFNLCNELVSVLDSGNLFPIVLGSNLPLFDFEKCIIADKYYYYNGEFVNSSATDHSKKNLLENAYMYLNAPYLWGGRSPFGIDCSGFTQMVFKLSGFKLKRDAYLQADHGEAIHLADEVMPGDLAFFENTDGKITHVGIISDKNKIIHASGKVRIDSFDHYGIYNDELKKYSHHLRMIKRIF